MKAKTLAQEQSLVMVGATIDLPVLHNPDEFAEVMRENMEGMGEQRFDKIQMPSGGGLAFTVVDENGEETPMEKLRGVILHKQPFKAWYAKSFDEKSEDDLGIPDCFSEDNQTGSGCPKAGIPAGQECATCPKGQWGSDRRGGKGKDCTDKIRLHVLLEGESLPKYIDLPPTSMGNFKDYMKRLTTKGNVFYGVVTTIGLESAKSGGGIKYSKVKFAKAAQLTPNEKDAIKGLIRALTPYMAKVSRESITYDTEAQGDDGFIDQIAAQDAQPWA